MFHLQWKALSRSTLPRLGKSGSAATWKGAPLGVMAAAGLGTAGVVIAHQDDGDVHPFYNGNFSTAPARISHCQGSVATTKDDNQEGTTGNGSTTTPVMASSASSFRLHDYYEIFQKPLGEGAYGLVHKARRKSDGVMVAIKCMPRKLTGKTDFEREVAALQLLSKPPGHAHIVQLYDLHRDEHNYYLAMELIEGGELLDHLIQSGPYSEALAASFLRQFAEAISYVHTNGLAHADLKPENLLLSFDYDNDDMSLAQLKVADFGCARTHDLSRKDMHLPAQEFAMGCSFLHMVALGNQFELEKMLQERPNLVNFRDYDFRTPLHLAASEGHVDICRFLVQRGARVNRSDRWGGSPLDDAHRHRHGEVIEYLRQQGATFGTLTQLPRFIQAASDGNVEEVLALLEFGNIDLDQGDYDKRTALHLAAGEGRKEVVELLCQEGANVNVEDRWGNRPIDDAKNAKKNSQVIMSYLAHHGGKSVKEPKLHQQVQFKPALSKRRTSTRRLKKEAEEETFSGTVAYWPPELFADGASPTPSSDMWAAGVIMYILLSGTHPFDKHCDMDDDDIERAIRRLGVDKENHMENLDKLVFDERIEGLSDSCVELMRQLLHPDPHKRMDADAFLQHPWIQGLTASWTTINKAHAELKAFWQNRFRTEILKKFVTGKNKDNKDGGDCDTIDSDNPPKLSEQDLTTLFNQLDLDENGVLELDEIQTAFRDVGISDKNIRTLFTSADLDGTGVIHFDEFRALLLSKDDNAGQELQVEYLQQRFKSHILKRFCSNDDDEKTKKDIHNNQEEIRRIFNAMDQAGNGKLDPHDIRVVLRSVGEPEDVISRIVVALDVNRRGHVSWDDFLQIMGVSKE